FSNYKYIDTTKILKEFSKNQDYSSLLKTKDLIDSFQSVCYDFGNAIKGFNESIKEAHLIDNESLSVPQIIFSETDRIKDLILKIYLNNEKLFELHPREFEKIIAELLYAKGFDVELTKQTRDNGYDILALKYID